MKLYAEQYDKLENTVDHAGFFLLMDGLVSGARDGDASAQQALNRFYDVYRAKNGINNVVGVVTLPKTMEVFVATFPIEQDGSIYILQFDAEVTHHYIFLDSVTNANFTRASLQDAVESMRGVAL